MKSQLFIVEGPDAVGKTTFARHLAKELGGVYNHTTCTSKLAPAMLDYQLNVLSNAQINLNAGHHVVLDRLWPSEACYGPVLRPDTMIDPQRIRMVTSNLDPVYIFCLHEHGVDAAIKQHEANLDPAHPYNQEVYMQIYRGYEVLAMAMQNTTPGKDRVIMRYFDPRITDQAKLDEYNQGFIHAIVNKLGIVAR